MKKFLFLAVLFLPSVAGAQAPEGMYLCSKASDCIVVEDFCPNNWRAINANETASYERWAAEMKPYVECMEMKASPKPAAECDGNRCIVHSPVPQKRK